MSFFKVNKEEANKAEGGNFISQSGIYDITIQAITVDVNDKDARTLGLYIEHNGSPQMMYGAIKLDNNDGTPNFQAPIFNKLIVIADLDDVNDPIEAELPIGEKKAMKDVAILEDFCDLEVKMRVQNEYSIYGDWSPKKGQIQEKRVIKGFYRADGAVPAEFDDESKFGTQLGKDEAYADNITYKDGLTAEDVTEWIKNGREGGPSGSTTSTTAAAPKKKSFGKK